MAQSEILKVEPCQCNIPLNSTHIWQELQDLRVSASMMKLHLAEAVMMESALCYQIEFTDTDFNGFAGIVFDLHWNVHFWLCDCDWFSEWTKSELVVLFVLVVIRESVKRLV